MHNDKNGWVNTPSRLNCAWLLLVTVIAHSIGLLLREISFLLQETSTS